MKPLIKLTAAALLGSGLCLSTATAEESAPSAEQVRVLLKRIEQLEQKVQSLEGTKEAKGAKGSEDLETKVKALERDRDAMVAKAKDAPKISIGEKGFSLTSADTNYSVQLKGLLQIDSRTFFGDAGQLGNDSFLVRRARPILAGTLLRDFDFQFVPDFGGSGTPQIYDAYLNYRYTPALQVRVGKTKSPVGLENLQSDQNTTFTERAFPTGLTPGRDVGAMVHGEPFGGVLTYAAGIFNGVGDGRNSGNVDFDDNKEFVGRLFAHPFKKTDLVALRGFGVGVAGSYEDMQQTNSSGTPNGNGYATPAQQQFFAYRSGVAAAGNHWRISPQGYYYYGPFGLLGEYVISDQEVSLGQTSRDSLRNTAWQIAGSWFLTGEDASFNGVVPRHSFNPRERGWGAWQVTARYSELDIDSSAFPTFANPAVSAHSAKEYGLGLHWYLNRNLRLSAAFSHIDFEGGGGAGSSAPATVTRRDENALLTRVQLSF